MRLCFQPTSNTTSGAGNGCLEHHATNNRQIAAKCAFFLQKMPPNVHMSEGIFCNKTVVKPYWMPRRRAARLLPIVPKIIIVTELTGIKTAAITGESVPLIAKLSPMKL